MKWIGKILSVVIDIEDSKPITPMTFILGDACGWIDAIMQEKTDGDNEGMDVLLQG